MKNFKRLLCVCLITCICFCAVGCNKVNNENLSSLSTTEKQANDKNERENIIASLNKVSGWSVKAYDLSCPELKKITDIYEADKIVDGHIYERYYFKTSDDSYFELYPRHMLQGDTHYQKVDENQLSSIDLTYESNLNNEYPCMDYKEYIDGEYRLWYYKIGNNFRTISINQYKEELCENILDIANYKTIILPDDEKIEKFENFLFKTNKGWYMFEYKITNEEDVKKYADVKREYTINIKPLNLDENIIFFDTHSSGGIVAVDKDGILYIGQG